MSSTAELQSARAWAESRSLRPVEFGNIWHWSPDELPGWLWLELQPPAESEAAAWQQLATAIAQIRREIADESSTIERIAIAIERYADGLEPSRRTPYLTAAILARKCK